MNRVIKMGLMVLLYLALAGRSPLLAQQKGQNVPGQCGLNAGAIPDPGFTYANLALNYSAGQLNNSNGNAFPNVTGTYAFWVDENIFYYIPKHKILGGYFVPYIVLSFANGSLVADIAGTNLSANGGGAGFADIFVEPLALGWHLKRADVIVGYGFTAPTGRFTPGASNNVGSGYWGNDITGNATVYLTKNKATTANLATVWEIHGQKDGTNITPGQAFTMEWGFGQVLPLKKDFTQLFQFGLVGYDQWQVSNNSGITSLLPYYSCHGVGFQTNYILPVKALSFFFKFYEEYSAKARPEGRTIVSVDHGRYAFQSPRLPQPHRLPLQSHSAGLVCST